MGNSHLSPCSFVLHLLFCTTIVDNLVRGLTGNLLFSIQIYRPRIELNYLECDHSTNYTGCDCEIFGKLPQPASANNNNNNRGKRLH